MNKKCATCAMNKKGISARHWNKTFYCYEHFVEILKQKAVEKKRENQDPTKKKECRYCKSNDYSERYSQHMKSKHADVRRYHAEEEMKSLFEYGIEIAKKRKLEK